MTRHDLAVYTAELVEEVLDGAVDFGAAADRQAPRAEAMLGSRAEQLYAALALDPRRVTALVSQLWEGVISDGE